MDPNENVAPMNFRYERIIGALLYICNDMMPSHTPAFSIKPTAFFVCLLILTEGMSCTGFSCIVTGMWILKSGRLASLLWDPGLSLIRRCSFRTCT